MPLRRRVMANIRHTTHCFISMFMSNCYNLNLFNFIFFFVMWF
jgi:hypothetical protein